ncbi:2-amino-4-hydroxy-6-hydroxymethyldihydropteridine pyrophosphokinase [Bacteroidia bacterium]|nr:2-amino-4-hydroxy-6-hydroxymethyldihydropteridine pyrophosphokinase [Bacteroidia bacterium]
MAENLIEKEIGHIEKKSSVYISDAWGFDCDDIFYNEVLIIKIDSLKKEIENYEIKNILHTLKNIERKIGRTQKTVGNGYQSREIDIDIIYFDDIIIDEQDIKIPHPLMQDRKFVLYPLNEIDSKKIHPILQKTTHQLLLECKDKGNIKKITAI